MILSVLRDAEGPKGASVCPSPHDVVPMGNGVSKLERGEEARPNTEVFLRPAL